MAGFYTGSYPVQNDYNALIQVQLLVVYVFGGIFRAENES